MFDRPRVGQNGVDCPMPRAAQKRLGHTRREGTTKSGPIQSFALMKAEMAVLDVSNSSFIPAELQRFSFGVC